ncbi:MAG: DbpA RNA binding domain-containing protein, partial [Bacteroidales bacterium]|nr:DbpA RNA binding domain-containing protein [Bacteroidales bacterium]
EIKFIFHYQLPLRNKEFTHRNGRTARMNRDGIAYVLHWAEESLPDFIQDIAPEIQYIESRQNAMLSPSVKWETLYITGGRLDKISKGDIAGLFIKQGQIQKDQLGVIELKQNCSYAAVNADIADKLIAKTNNSKLKNKKVRISLI